ncbi:MAG: pyridoxamine 5'-phosphate oxidase [Ilumatobacteraceae bacterium]
MTSDPVRDRRSQYETSGLERSDLLADPMAQWTVWHDAAFSADLLEPNAMVLATVDADGGPDTRVVLVRSADERGFAFFTNYASTKSRQLAACDRAAANFTWLAHHRQVRVRGHVERLSAAESDDYFASRPRDSQIGAWASPQSEVVDDRRAIDELVAAASARFAESVVPRPPEWGGWLLRPVTWEFWQGRPNRLHDRFKYEWDGSDWRIDRLAP